MSLAIVAPSNCGLVLAVDDRVGFLGRHLDEVPKLQRASTGYLWATTGYHRGCLPPAYVPDPDEDPAGFVEAWENVAVQWEVNSTVGDVLDGSDGVLSLDVVHELAGRLQDYLNGRHAGQGHEGRQLLRIAVGGHHDSRSIAAFILASVKENGDISVEPGELVSWPLDHPFALELIGESDYCKRNVLMVPEVNPIPQGSILVRDCTPSDVESWLREVIRRTSLLAQADETPPEHGIGRLTMLGCVFERQVTRFTQPS